MIIQIFKASNGNLTLVDKESLSAKDMVRYSNSHPLVAEFEAKDVKKKVKKTVEKWVNVYPTYVSGSYDSLEDAIEGCSSGRISSVRVMGEYEVEE